MFDGVHYTASYLQLAADLISGMCNVGGINHDCLFTSPTTPPTEATSYPESCV